MASLSPSKMSSTSKAQEILLSVFGEPKSGFTGVGYPTESEVVSYWMWIMNLEAQTKRGVNRSNGHGDAVTKIFNSLMVQWRFAEGVPRATKDCVKRRIRDIIDKAKGLTKFTKKMNDQGWISDQQRLFSSIVDITDRKPEASHEVTKHSFW